MSIERTTLNIDWPTRPRRAPTGGEFVQDAARRSSGVEGRLRSNADGCSRFSCLAVVRDAGGGVMTTFALLLPVLLGVCWVALNFSFMESQKFDIQAAADAAALAAAKQLSLTSQTATTIQQFALNTALINLPSNSYLASPDQITTTVDTAGSSVSVSITRTLLPLLGSDFGVSSNVVTSTATAQYNSSRICVLILDPEAASAFSAQGTSNLTAVNCAILSNSSSAAGLSGTTTGAVTSAKACSAGGYVGGAFVPAPITDCPVVADPLASRAPPPNVNSGCDYVNYSATWTYATLQPGVYCGGITIQEGALTFEPGDYIIRGGALNILTGAAAVGTGVGFYLTGGAYINAQSLSGLYLGAPSDANDPMVGLVFWEDPKNSSSGTPVTHTINSDFGQTLHGTAYFPQGTLYVGGTANLGSTAAYTIIVAHALVIDQNANVILNSNYSSSNIPVPQGVGNTGGAINLSR